MKVLTDEQIENMDEAIDGDIARNIGRKIAEMENNHIEECMRGLVEAGVLNWEDVALFNFANWEIEYLPPDTSNPNYRQVWKYKGVLMFIIAENYVFHWDGRPVTDKAIPGRGYKLSEEDE